jgi:CheY-like chemotaxis protein
LVDGHCCDPSGGDPALSDAIPWASVSWWWLMYRLRGILRSPADPPAGSSSAESAAASGTIPSMAGRRILIAEDVTTNQVLLQAVLAPTGAELEVVADGAEVLERHRQAPADLILMDLQMPGTGGIAALRQIRALPGPVGSVPVVALTAYARSADRQLALDTGMDAYLAKPIVVAEFYDLVRQLLAEPARPLPDAG